jgi:hypothetical protein
MRLLTAKRLPGALGAGTKDALPDRGSLFVGAFQFKR